MIGITAAAVDIARLREMTDRLQEAKDKLVLEKSYLESEIQAELGFEEIIGQSPALRDVLKKARVVAPTDSTVLLLGETGTGKELVARAVHALSSRHGRNFIKLNCAAVPSGLLESELFGHEKGAFTGAVSQKVGRIELADKGTLFLDEIGELPLELQPKLLRVLQDREFERLGGIHTLHVDVRIISATNRDLQQDIADRKFREDLFYRLNVFPIQLPPLRERRSDIPMLVHHFVRKHAARMGKHIEAIPDETMDVLQNWILAGQHSRTGKHDRAHGDHDQGRHSGRAAGGTGCAAGSHRRQSHRDGTGAYHSDSCAKPMACCRAGWSSQPVGNQAHNAAIHAQALWH